MRIHFIHHTRYRYSQPVELQPQLLRLRPREDAFQRLPAYQCSLSPVERQQTPLIDSEGNSLIRAWIQRSSMQLDIHSTGVVETLRDNPFDFLLNPDALTLPLKGLAIKHPTLMPCLVLSDMNGGEKKIRDLAATLLKESRGDTVSYVTGATKLLCREFKRLQRDEGEAWSAEETLRQGMGSCRDLAVLLMELCRIQGLPARFVSGYFLEHPDRKDHDLHAWTEVYLPGAGWRGFDPSIGLACGSHHITLCASAKPADCAPLSGTFIGGKLLDLSVSLELRA